MGELKAKPEARLKRSVRPSGPGTLRNHQPPDVGILVKALRVGRHTSPQSNQSVSTLRLRGGLQ